MPGAGRVRVRGIRRVGMKSPWRAKIARKSGLLERMKGRKSLSFRAEAKL